MPYMRLNQQKCIMYSGNIMIAHIICEDKQNMSTRCPGKRQKTEFRASLGGNHIHAVVVSSITVQAACQCAWQTTVGTIGA